MGESTYKVVWPLGKLAYEKVSPAHCVPDLSYKTICELWDWRFRGEEIFPIIRESLLDQYPGIKFVGSTKFGSTHCAKEAEVIAALPDLLRKHGCDAVISGVGG